MPDLPSQRNHSDNLTGQQTRHLQKKSLKAIRRPSPFQTLSTFKHFLISADNDALLRSYTYCTQTCKVCSSTGGKQLQHLHRDDTLVSIRLYSIPPTTTQSLPLPTTSQHLQIFSYKMVLAFQDGAEWSTWWSINWKDPTSSTNSALSTSSKLTIMEQSDYFSTANYYTKPKNSMHSTTINGVADHTGKPRTPYFSKNCHTTLPSKLVPRSPHSITMQLAALIEYHVRLQCWQVDDLVLHHTCVKCKQTHCKPSNTNYVLPLVSLPKRTLLQTNWRYMDKAREAVQDLPRGFLSHHSYSIVWNNSPRESPSPAPTNI